MRMKKIGLLGLALVLVLALTGAGFAAWTDDLTIEGTVDTGTVGGSYVWVSGTWVYKVVGEEHDIVVQHAGGLVPGERPTPPVVDLEPIAYGEVKSITEDAAGAETATIEFSNLFPCVYFCVDILWHYWGTVPAKVNSISDVVWVPDEGTDPDLLDDIWHGAIAVRANADGDPIDAAGNVVDLHSPDVQPVDVGTQLHGCDYVLIIIAFHVPQDNAYMGLGGSGTIHTDLVQWNEYPYTP